MSSTIVRIAKAGPHDHPHTKSSVIKRSDTSEEFIVRWDLVDNEWWLVAVFINEEDAIIFRLSLG